MMENITKQRSLKIQMETIWWVITAIVSYIILHPIINNFISYKFLYTNVLFIVVFLTYARYIFLLKHTFLAHLQPIKFILVFASVPLVFHLIEQLQNFQYFLETEGLRNIEQYFVEGTPSTTRDNIYM